MPVVIAYIFVVLIWSTTPLAIVWSSETISPTLALLLRMAIALVLGLMLLPLLKLKMDWRPKAIKVYLYSSLSLALGMLCCYLAARYISSGLMSLIFGIAPILSGWFAQKILFEQKFSPLKKLALTVSFIGLGIVCADNIQGDFNVLYGVLFILVGVITFSLSGVLVKSVDIQMHPLITTMGSLILSMPAFVIFFLVADGDFNVTQWTSRAVWSVIYLGVFASLIGFLAYFYILSHLPASTVSLVVMITPILASYLGVLLNNETASSGLFIGGAMVLFGLALFLFGHKLGQLGIFQHWAKLKSK